MPPTARELGLMQGFPPPDDKLITADMFQDAPANRWSFQHVSRLLPTAVISRGAGAVATPARAPRDLGEIALVVDGVNQSVDEMLEATYTDGFLVLKDGAVAHESYYNDMTPDTHHLLQSVSKSLTGALIGILIERGLIDPTALVTRYVPDLRESAYGDATVQQALDMQVGVVFNEDYADPNSEIQRYDRVTGWRALLPGDEHGTYRFIRSLRKDGDHGRAFQYCSANTDVLAWIVERVSGLSFAEMLGSELWAKLGAEHDAYVTVDRYGSALADGGICVTLRDLGRFGQMILAQGQVNGRAVVPAAWIHDMRHNGDNSIWRQGKWWPEVFPHGSYHNQWWQTGNEHRSFFASGIYGQRLWIDPTANVVIVKLSSNPIADDYASMLSTIAAFTAIGEALK